MFTSKDKSGRELLFLGECTTLAQKIENEIEGSEDEEDSEVDDVGM
jgi:hypothetical protein